MLRKLSCGSASNDVEQHRSRLIDKELRADRKRYRSTYRLLLLGTTTYLSNRTLRTRDRSALRHLGTGMTKYRKGPTKDRKGALHRTTEDRQS